MSAPIVTPLTVRDAEALTREAIGTPGTYSRAAAIERVTALVMRVDVASREQSGATELLETLKILAPVIRSLDDLPGGRRDGTRLGTMVDAVIAKAEAEGRA